MDMIWGALLHLGSKPDKPERKQISKVLKGIDLFKAARGKHYPG